MRSIEPFYSYFCRAQQVVYEMLEVCMSYRPTVCVSSTSQEFIY